jgi:hypothetical protein
MDNTSDHQMVAKQETTRQRRFLTSGNRPLRENKVVHSQGADYNGTHREPHLFFSGSSYED